MRTFSSRLKVDRLNVDGKKGQKPLADEQIFPSLITSINKLWKFGFRILIEFDCMMRIVTDELTAELNPKFLPSMANVRVTSATLPAILKLCTFFAFSRRLSLSQHRIIDFPLSACQIPTKTLPDHNSTWFSLVLMKICCLVRWKTCASFRFTAAESTLKCCLCFNNVAGKLINFPPSSF